jgi:hypothetical protein
LGVAVNIVVYIPVYNGVEWCRRLSLAPGLHYVASDNCSTDGSGRVLEERGVEVIYQTRNLGRIGNWAFCVRHFLESGKPWMKWLFAGDILADNFAEVAERATLAFPAARMVVGDNVHVDGEFRAYYKVMPETRLLQPHESLELLARGGNWFYSPINQMFHRDALVEGHDFGPFSWAGDVYFCMNVAAKVPVLYWAESFGEFHVAERVHFKSLGGSFLALLETALVREMAARRLASETGDLERHSALSLKIEADLLRRLSARQLERSVAGSWLLAGLRAARRLGLHLRSDRGAGS